MRKYLNDIGIKDKDLPWKWNPDDKRRPEWKEERKTYGFDERDTWSLYYTLTLLTYERLKDYRDRAPVDMDQVDDTFGCNLFTFEDKDIVFGVAIDRILKSFENFLTAEGRDGFDDEFTKCWALLGVILPGLWW